MSSHNLRGLRRTVHTVAGALLVAYLYTPLGEQPLAGLINRAVVVPVLVLSGVAMWQMPRLRRLQRRLVQPTPVLTFRRASAQSDLNRGPGSRARTLAS